MSTLRDEPPAHGTVGDQSHGVMQGLRAAASSGDEATLLDLLDSVGWELDEAADYSEAINLALTAGAHQAARRLARAGTQRYPTDSELRESARVLAPSTSHKAESRARYGTSANRNWLRDNSPSYRGKWVALRNGELLGVADTLAELSSEINGTEGVLLTVA